MEFNEKQIQLASKMSAALVLQVLSGGVGIVFSILIRKSRFFLLINTIVVILAVLGYVGYSSRRKNIVALHGYITLILSSIIFVYQFVLELVKNVEILGFLLLLPFVANIIIGSLSLIFLNKTDEIYHIPQTTNSLSENFMQKRLCVVCNDRDPNFMIYDCGHKCLCGQCSTALTKNKSKCPMCRKTIINIVKVYD